MYGFLKRLAHRNNIQRQFGFYSDYRSCVMDLLTLSLNTPEKTSSTHSLTLSKSAFSRQMMPRISSKVQSGWITGISAEKCRDSLLQGLHSEMADNTPAENPQVNNESITHHENLAA